MNRFIFSLFLTALVFCICLANTGTSDNGASNFLPCLARKRFLSNYDYTDRQKYFAYIYYDNYILSKLGLGGSREGRKAQQLLEKETKRMESNNQTIAMDELDYREVYYLLAHLKERVSIFPSTAERRLEKEHLGDIEARVTTDPTSFVKESTSFIPSSDVSVPNGCRSCLVFETYVRVYGPTKNHVVLYNTFNRRRKGLLSKLGFESSLEFDFANRVRQRSINRGSEWFSGEVVQSFEVFKKWEEDNAKLLGTMDLTDEGRARENTFILYLVGEIEKKLQEARVREMAEQSRRTGDSGITTSGGNNRQQENVRGN